MTSFDSFGKEALKSFDEQAGAARIQPKPMKRIPQPFNVSLYTPTANDLRMVQEVTSLDTVDGPGGNFHEQGLFSTSIFGRVGDPARDRTFGFIDLKVPVFHPLVFKTLIKLKGLYGGIMSGREFAIFNTVKGEFERSNEIEGRTGMSFFMEFFPQLKFPKGDSDIRNLRINLLEKYRDQLTVTKILVLPAGLRDAEVDVDGRMSFDEINELYQSLLILSRNYPERITPRDDLSIYDRTRYGITMKFVAIYEHLENLISGKGGFIQSRWASRVVFNGTRNVLTSLDVTAANLDAPNYPRFNDSVLGLYQASNALMPKVIHGLKEYLVGQIFDTSSNRVHLVNKQTLKLEWVDVSNEDMDTWGTDQGLERVVGELEVIEKRTRAVEVADHYLALVYLDDKSNFRIIRDLDDLPQGLDPKWVRPISYAEMIYLTNLHHWNKNTVFITRFPVENMNSSYPSKLYIRTTVVAELRYRLDENGERDGQLALEYPIFELGKPAQFHDSTSVSATRLKPLGADFDGDTVSATATYSKEAIEETDRYFTTRAAYLSPNGDLAFSIGVDTLDLTMRYITGEPLF